jgi:hypothetical protein
MTVPSREMAVGKCPECEGLAVFIPTRIKHIFKCDICLENVRQHVNGKVSWFKLSEIPLGGPIKY